MMANNADHQLQPIPPWMLISRQFSISHIYQSTAQNLMPTNDVLDLSFCTLFHTQLYEIIMVYQLAYHGIDSSSLIIDSNEIECYGSSILASIEGETKDPIIDTRKYGIYSSEWTPTIVDELLHLGLYLLHEVVHAALLGQAEDILNVIDMELQVASVDVRDDGSKCPRNNLKQVKQSH